MEFASNTTSTRSFHLDLSLHTNQNIPFPWKLHEMLDTCEREGLSHIVSWLPDNGSFRVHNPSYFMENVIKNFFKQTKYKSFQRQLNIWGFQRIISGPNKGGYSHKYFIRSNESLCCMMSRQKIKGQKRAKPRPYFPFKAISASNGKSCGLNDIRSFTSIQDQALNIILGKDSFPTNCMSLKSMLGDVQNCEDFMQRDMMPLYANTRAACQTSMPSNQMDGSDHGSGSSSYGDSDGTISPRGVGSYPSSPIRPKRPISPLTFGETCDANDENLMECLSPDPIAPDHPLSKKMQQNKASSTSNLNHAITNTIDDLVQDDFSFF